MKLTKHDKPIGKAQASKPFENDWQPECRGYWSLKRSDTHQMTWAQLCRTTGKNWSTFWYQVNRNGKSPLAALRCGSTPEVVMSWWDICAKAGVDKRSFNRRRAQGWTVRQALSLAPPPEHAGHSAHMTYWTSCDAATLLKELAVTDAVHLSSRLKTALASELVAKTREVGRDAA